MVASFPANKEHPQTTCHCSASVAVQHPLPRGLQNENRVALQGAESCYRSKQTGVSLPGKSLLHWEILVGGEQSKLLTKAPVREKPGTKTKENLHFPR